MPRKLIITGAFRGIWPAALLALAGILLGLPAPVRAQSRELPRRIGQYLREVGFSPPDIEAVRNDQAVAVIQNTGEKTEVLVYGIVFIDSSIQSFLDLYRDEEALAGNEGFLAVGKFSDPPRPEDLVGFTFADTDFKDLRTCRRNACNLQLGEEMIEAAQRIDWSSPRAEAEANRLLQARLLEGLRRYQAKGNHALGTYLNMKYDLNVKKTFETLLKRIHGLSDDLPEVKHYLEQYPNATLPKSEDYFYWEKVNFGLKTTLRVNHVLIYEPEPRELRGHLVINKQLWASHYFQSAIDIWLGLEDALGPKKGGFYLTTIKISRQQALAGFKGSIIRSVAVPRARRGVETALATFKEQLESK